MKYTSCIEKNPRRNTSRLDVGGTYIIICSTSNYFSGFLVPLVWAQNFFWRVLWR